MSNKNPAEYLAFLLEKLPQLRSEIQSVRQSGLNSEIKSDGSWVTAADQQTEKKFREIISSNFPDHGFLGEEFGVHQPESPYQWIIDPIDGTAEFRTGMPEWGTVIGLHYNGKPIVGLIDCPDLNYLVYAALGCGTWLDSANGKEQLHLSPTQEQSERHRIRFGISPLFSFNRFGGKPRTNLFHNLCENFSNQRILHNCYIHLLVLMGALEVGVEWRMRIWDISGLQLLTEEAGGKYSIVENYSYEKDQIYSVVYGKKDLVDQALKIINDSPAS